MRSARVLVAWETARQQDGGAAGRLAGPVIASHYVTLAGLEHTEICLSKSWD